MISKPRVSAFYLEYAGLVLILLTFITGAFCKPNFLDKEAEMPTKLNFQYKFHDLKLEELFIAGEARVDEARVGALAAFLSSHDLDAKIQLREKIATNVDRQLGTTPELGLARAVALARFLAQHGVPEDSVVVTTIQSTESGPDVNIELIAQKTKLEALLKSTLKPIRGDDK